MSHYRSFLFVLTLLLGTCPSSFGQTPDKEFWPDLKFTFDPQPRVGMQVSFEKHDGEDVSLTQWKFGTFLSYRIRRIVQTLRDDIDNENQYNLAVGGGYEYIRTKTSSTKTEYRIVVQATPKYILGAGILVQDRNRTEFRWVDGAYNFRYRNKLTADRQFKIDKVRFTPYASGELFWDRNHHAWNENQYAFGVQLPYKKVLMLDLYYLRQNCTTCSQDPVSVFGVTVNFYYKRK